MRDKVLAVIAAYAEGASVKKAMRELGVQPRAFYQLMASDVELGNLYEASKTARAEILVDEVITISDDAEANPNRARNQIDARKWAASKLRPQMYGDRLIQELDIGPNLVEAIAQAKQRLLPPPRDLSQTIDAEYTALEPPNAQGATDKQSDEPVPAAQAPDIFG